MERKIPTRLRNDPLVGVIFEVRFESSMPLSNILPGLLFNHLGTASLMKTPAAEVPESIRISDPNFAYMPVVILDVKRYQVHIGDKVLQIQLNMPYLGWNYFKPIIMDIYNQIAGYNLINAITRFSLKYIDIIEPNHRNSLDDMLNIKFLMGSNKITLDNSQFRTEIHNKENAISAIFQLAGNAKAEFVDDSVRTREGFLIDIDCLKNVGQKKPVSFEKDIDEDLEELHSLSKNYFFSFLTDIGIESLEPEYD